MTARVLVVDDVAANVKLLEAKLMADYFDVSTASNGPEALEMAAKVLPDIILLDVMMPGMDGFEVCRRIKADPNLTHIPIVMVTALDQPSDRVQGLDAGADDFLTKPVNDIGLFARVRSLVRLKTMTDELRMREATGRRLGILEPFDPVMDDASLQGRILLVEDRPKGAQRLVETLAQTHAIETEADPQQALERTRTGELDLVIVSLSAETFDGLRLCSQLRSYEETRHTPILVLVEDGDTKRLVRALDMGVNDYLMRPVDRNELLARVRTQLRRKRYADRLRENFHLSLQLAVTDSLTGLYNRRYMTSHLSSLVQRAQAASRPVSIMFLDIDFFKSVNDQYGHDVGDVVLKEFAVRIARNIRSIDLACRFGGEEFVVVMPETELSVAQRVAERMRQQVAEAPFVIPVAPGEIAVTTSIGVTCSGETDNPDQMMRRADEALYRAKRDGRNRVISESA